MLWKKPQMQQLDCVLLTFSLSLCNHYFNHGLCENCYNGCTIRQYREDFAINLLDELKKARDNWTFHRFLVSAAPWCGPTDAESTLTIEAIKTWSEQDLCLRRLLVLKNTSWGWAQVKLFHHFTSFNISHLTFISVTSGLCHLAHIVPESKNDFI